jgi:hypothetical protein
MSKQRNDSDAKSPGTLARSSLFWLGLAVMVIVLIAIIAKRIQARARSGNQHAGETPGVLAVITNSGSTNAPGSTLTINTDGSGTLTYQKGTQGARFQSYRDRTFPTGTFESNQLENVLTQIKDVGTIPNRDCLKSVSFGSTTTITYQGKTSGDLSCLSNEDPKVFLDLKDLVLQHFYPRLAQV